MPEHILLDLIKKTAQQVLKKNVKKFVKNLHIYIYIFAPLFFIAHKSGEPIPKEKLAISMSVSYTCWLPLVLFVIPLYNFIDWSGASPVCESL